MMLIVMYNQYVYCKEQKLSRPLVIRSSRASGGCVSTTKEIMIFLKAFFGRKLFHTDLIAYTKTYNKIQKSMGPLDYGCGHMRLALDGIRTCFQGHGSLVGHFGSTGSFAFYYPEKDLFFTGDINQMANISIAYRFVMQLAMLC